MIRSQQAWHRALWWVLAPLLVVALAWALLGRGEVPRQELPAAAQEVRGR